MANRKSLQQRIFCVKKFYELSNVNSVCRNYTEEYGDSIRWHTVKEIVNKFEETGSVADMPKTGRPPSVNTEQNQLIINEVLTQQPRNSLRNLSKELDIAFASVQRIIKKLGLKVWRPRLLQQLNDDDFDRRLEFCERFGELFNDNLNVIWTDEAIFKMNGQINRHNCVYYCVDNPHEVFEKSVNSPGVHVWAGICPTNIIGPYFFPNTVNGETYLNMLNSYAFPQIRQLNRERGDQFDMWWQQDGAPPHYARNVRERLDEEFPNRWIGRRGPVEWPPRSPDLSPLDFSVWGIVKEMVFKNQIQNLDHLKMLIRQAFETFDEELCHNICLSLRGRIQQCMNADGGHFENKRQ